MEFSSLAQRLVAGHELAAEEAGALMRLMISGEATEGQIGAALAALACRGVTAAELASFAGEVRAHAAKVGSGSDALVDTCGTGGGIPSFNISTAAALIASASGVVIAKHGNRAVTSSCGSADVLEALGVRLGIEPEAALHLLESVGIVFLFAPAHHPALRHVGKVRKELGFRTVFNMIGPLANPAGAKRQLVGVYSADLVGLMAEALARLGIERAWVAHGTDGLDEISPCAPTAVAEADHGQVRTMTVAPQDFGLEPLDPSALAPGKDVNENAAILQEAVSDPDSPRFRAALPSAAAALYLADAAEDLRQAAELARDTVRAGKALAKLRQLAEASQRA
jgi:anthranilate phosphoribosyltransferase